MSYLLSKINLQTTQLCRNLPSITFQHCFRASWLYFGPGMTAWPQPRPCFSFELHCILSNSFSSLSPLSGLAPQGEIPAEEKLLFHSACSVCRGLWCWFDTWTCPWSFQHWKCGHEIPRPHHRQPQESSTPSAQQYCWKINKIQGLAGRIMMAEKRTFCFSWHFIRIAQQKAGCLLPSILYQKKSSSWFVAS